MTGLSLQAWEVIAELIGAIGLIFSLLFVGFQIRFAVKANRMERMNQQLEIVRDQALQTAISPDLARILVSPQRITASSPPQSACGFPPICRRWRSPFPIR